MEIYRNPMNFFLALLFALAIAAFRLMPHPANFVPIGALALFFGARFPKKLSIPIVIVAMVASDWIIGFYDWRLMVVVYGAFAFDGFVGAWIGRKFSWMNFFLGAASGSLFFYFSTNFGVWILSPWYPHTLAGLMACYAAGLPFLRNTFLGDMVFGATFFAAYEYIKNKKMVLSIRSLWKKNLLKSWL
jgi:hypothetical protein